MKPPFPNLRSRDIVREVFTGCFNEVLRLTRNTPEGWTLGMIEAFAVGYIRGELVAILREPTREHDATLTFVRALFIEIGKNDLGFVRRLTTDITDGYAKEAAVEGGI